MMKYILFVMIFSGCADLTTSGSKVKFIESSGNAIEVQELADRYVSQNDCRFVGYVDAETSLFPGSYSLHENEIHSALRNRAAKMGVNVVVANFYQKPARGVGLLCSER